ncbi:MAG: hypothetical protein R2744_07270 [Bacteroidales bacterium]
MTYIAGYAARGSAVLHRATNVTSPTSDDLLPTCIPEVLCPDTGGVSFFLFTKFFWKGFCKLVILVGPLWHTHQVDI